MQSELGELTDLKSETEATRRLYGLDRPQSRDFGGKCLLARRLVERGVHASCRSIATTSGTRTGNIQSNHATMGARPTPESPACSSIWKGVAC